MPPWLIWACLFVLALATVVAFLPVLSAGFVEWDDPTYLTENDTLRQVGGLKDIWNPLVDQPRDYFPLVFTSYWVEYHLWKLNPAGYHATNLLLHAIDAGLVLLVIRALGASLWVAFVAAAVFALHPVQVESVAWVTERKNTLSALFYLSAFLLYLTHRRTGSRWAYGGSLLAFCAGVLSKPQIVTLPVVLFVTDAFLQRAGRLPRDRLRHVALKLAPMLAVAAGSSAMTTAVSRRIVPLQGEVPAFAERTLMALNAPWVYLATFVAPLHLAPIYPRWHPAFTDPTLWLGAFAWVPVLLLLWRYRSRVDGLCLWGGMHFCVTLIPVLGIVWFNGLQESYFGDRFLYLSCIGGGVAFAVLAEQIGRSAGPRARRAIAVAVGLILIACGVGTYLQTWVWHTNFNMWMAAVERTPDSFPANINLARSYASQGHWAEAVHFYAKARQTDPNNMWAFRGYMNALAKTRGPQAVAEACSAELQGSTALAEDAHLFRAVSYELLGRRAAALADYEQVLDLAKPGSKEWQQAQRARQRLAQAPDSE